MKTIKINNKFLSANNMFIEAQDSLLEIYYLFDKFTFPTDLSVANNKRFINFLNSIAEDVCIETAFNNFLKA